MTLASDQVTVPAGGTSSVEVLLDPTIADPGSYSAVVTATPDDGGGTVRTGLAYLLEPEQYDVTVTVKPRAGSQSVSHQLGLSGYGEPWIYEQRSFGAAPGAQTATFRLPPGTYATGAISFGLAADGAQEGIVSYDPSFTVSKNTEIVLDENQTGRFGYQVDRPVVDDGAILDVDWTAATATAGSTFFGAVDRLYARPSAGLAGAANVSANWLLSQPEGLLTPAGRKPVALRPVPAAGATPAETPVPEIDGRFRIVDAGSAAPPRTSSLKGAVALVSGTCTDLTAPPTHSRRPVRQRWWPTPPPVPSAPGPSTGPPTCPRCRPGRGTPRLCSRPGRPCRAGHPQVARVHVRPGEVWADGVPNGGTVRGTGNSVAALVEHYSGMGSTSADGLLAVEELIGWVPERGGVANIGLVRAVPFPATVTHYVSTGAVWERTVAVQDAQYGGEYGRLYAPRRTFGGGTTTHDTWFGGPIGSRVSPLITVTNGSPPPTREGDDLYLSMGAFTDAAGHMANSDMFSNEYNGKIYVDDVLVHDMFASVFMNTDHPRR